VSSISQHGSVADVIDIRSDSEDDFNDCSYSTDDHHSTSDIDNHDDVSLLSPYRVKTSLLMLFPILLLLSVVPLKAKALVLLMLI